MKGTRVAPGSSSLLAPAAPRGHPLRRLVVGLLLAAAVLATVLCAELRQRGDAWLTWRSDTLRELALSALRLRQPAAEPPSLAAARDALALALATQAPRFELLDLRTGEWLRHPAESATQAPMDAEVAAATPSVQATSAQSDEPPDSEPDQLSITLPDTPFVLRVPQQPGESLTQAARGMAGTLSALVLLFVAVAIVMLESTRRALRRERHLADLAEQRSATDPLTGLPNRRALEQRFADLKAQALRTDARLGLLLIDIDHFRRLNERLGHAQGDQTLQAVARHLERSIRESDAIARIGGAAFVVLLSGSPNLFLGVAAERYRQKTEHTPFDAGTVEPVHLTISIGAHLLSLPEESLESALGTAHRALLRAKAQGRNRVVLSSALAPTPQQETRRDNARMA